MKKLYKRMAARLVKKIGMSILFFHPKKYRLLLGLTFIPIDIHTDWALPFKLTHNHAQYLLQQFLILSHSSGADLRKNKAKINEFYCALVKLNPVLGKVQCSTWQDKFHVSFGAVSKFNVEDIKFFVEIDTENRTEVYLANVLRLEHMIKRIFELPEYYIGYVISPNTLNVVNNVLATFENKIDLCPVS
jgi:hypothetical protein